jgi:hypothetical protein
MRTMQQWFDGYAKTHQTTFNKKMHCFLLSQRRTATARNYIAN